MKYKVYLAGPITGCTYGGCTDWRQYVKYNLDSEHVACMDPMRCKQLWERDEVVDNTRAPKDHPMVKSRAILTRDRTDCTTCNVLLVNFQRATRVSIGTVMEIAWAHYLRIPVVVVLPEGENIHHHEMLDETYDFITHDLDEACDIVHSIIGVD